MGWLMLGDGEDVVGGRVVVEDAVVVVDCVVEDTVVNRNRKSYYKVRHFINLVDSIC